ncbi:MAG TPA: hypothetical protein VNZ01_06700 [Solirubrobacteraceae bacterium]|jgi:hypothetical protein|nr:hypothetical protein [Solirubrobacteraceae bacterium]
MSKIRSDTYAACLEGQQWGPRRFSIRVLLSTLLVSAAAASLVPSSAHAEFGIRSWEAGTCKSDVPACLYASPESQFYTQAAGHPPLGITGFEVNTTGLGEPEGKLKDVRVDIPPGLSTNPQAVPQCTEEQFKSIGGCPSSTKVGENEITAFVGITKFGPVSLPVYNLVPPEGSPAEFGFNLEIGPVKTQTLIVGGVSWYHEPETSENSGVPTGDYHEFFTIREIPTTLSIVKTRLKFTGTAGDGTFLTLPSACGTQTSYLHIDSHEAPGQFQARATVSGEPPRAISVGGCEHVPFGPGLSLSPGPGEAAADSPDGLSVDLHVPQNPNGTGSPNSADLRTSRVTLPEGMTANPSSAHGLDGCTEAQIAIGSNAPIGCPEASKIGSVAIETPVLPPGSLIGAIYLGKPATGPITGPPFTVYLGIESKRYGVGVRLKGITAVNESNGQLTTTFENNPPDPFEDFIVTFKGGPRATLANPLTCTSKPVSSLDPYSGQAPASVVLSSPFAAGPGSACSVTAPFTLGQSTQNSASNAGASTSYTFNLTRPDGQQYLSKVNTVLPPGLVGVIPSVTLCGEPQAQKGTCSSASQIGVARVKVGAGSEPYEFEGPVYLTGPYNGAPYGLSVPVPAVAGPFNLGIVVTRAAINVDTYSGRVIATSNLPTIVKGVPLRLRSLSVAVNRPGLLLDPTSCAPLATDSTLTSTALATQFLSSPFQVTSCGGLAFKPTFAASSNAHANKAGGALLQVNVTQGARQANIRSVFTQLPLQLPSRLTTLQKACPEATFAANPFSCPEGSNVGHATALTPVLSTPLTGPAYLVSHGGAAFPDLDIVLEGSGVRVILVGNTDIKKGITSSTFAAIPDVPVTSFSLTLPMGPHSVLGANGSLCAHPLVMPTTITAQSGAQVKQNTKIAVAGCPVKILKRRIVHRALVLTVQTFGAGRIIVTGRSLRTASRSVRGPTTATIRVRLSSQGARALNNRRRLKVGVRVRFNPGQKGESGSTASTTVTFTP